MVAKIKDWEQDREDRRTWRCQGRSLIFRIDLGIWYRLSVVQSKSVTREATGSQDSSGPKVELPPNVNICGKTNGCELTSFHVTTRIEQRR